MRYSVALLALAASLTSAAPTAPNNNIIPDEYIVVFQKDVSTTTIEAHKHTISALINSKAKRSGTAPSQLGKTFEINWFKGYSGKFDKKTLAQIKADPKVRYVQPNGMVHTMQDDKKPKQTVECAQSWGLARVAHAEKGRTSYAYKHSDTVVDVYVIDTGIQADHKEFEGRATFDHNAVDGSKDTDENGHGTHCAGTIASKSYGVCKNCHVHGVKVLDANGSGSFDGVMAGMDWVAKNAKKPCVASMSLGGGKNDGLNEAANALAKTCVLAVAAGNSNANDKDFSPASASDAISVGATDNTDKIAYFSNWGPGIEVFAPGVNITSTWMGGGVNTISGTSMATPHVAGTLAYLISIGELKFEGAKDALQALALKGKVGGLDGGDAEKAKSPNLLLQNHADEEADPKDCKGGDKPPKDPDQPPKDPDQPGKDPLEGLPAWLKDFIKQLCKLSPKTCKAIGIGSN